MKKMLAAIAAVAFTFGSGMASADVIDFESIPQGSCAWLGSSVTTQGFTFQDTSGGGLFNCNAGVIHTGSSSALIAANTLSSLTFFDELSAPFSLAGFEAGARTTNPTTGVLVTGTRADASTVQQTITFSGLSFDTFSLGNAFSNLVSVNILSLGPDRSEFLIDNIEVNVSAVPLPAGLPLLLAGLCGLGVTARRRKTS